MSREFRRHTNPSVCQLDRRIDCLNLRLILGADALNTQDLDPMHSRLPRNDWINLTRL
jgi:hypothetical protein